jgi:hypothetical protein
MTVLSRTNQLLLKILTARRSSTTYTYSLMLSKPALVFGDDNNVQGVLAIWNAVLHGDIFCT